MRLFVLNAKTDGGNFRQLIQVNVARIIQAAQLTRLSKPGEMISSNMINKKRVEVKSEQANLPVSYSDAVGKCLERFKSAGTILRSSDVSDKTTDICAEPAKKRMKHKRRKLAFKGSDRSQWVVNPGDQVKFLFSNGSLALSFPAKAIEGGEIGDHIRLINLKTKKRIQGKITDRGQVEYAKN
jgi:flagella basal body P-ring formation protein FlgA